ncbi:anaerobic ribonucleoside-triphosphate reductase activating protein [Clostridium sp. D2Q-11]|uniref:Anaerobic ribonucleoside-triphosphate reductase activating protein n=2 Tax=Anaeromonas frigoriresistens TaxID=2683708 RepID=A0A942UZE9_9FIRM|nr:anaerobic ribonucleoside-triphosphate reductase activating protein [Anaeromonas frigoriresistens]
MEICEIEKSSFIDYPGKISTILFIKGCNFRCPYCHNSHIINNNKNPLDQGLIMSFLNKRKKFIDAVTITGGEPTLYNELYALIKEIKKQGFSIKLDTNGTNPKIIEKLLDNNLVDYIAMDIKTSFKRYGDVTNALVDINKIKESIRIIKNSDIDYEFRTTICKELIDKNDVLEIADYLRGSKRYILQNFRDRDTVLDGKNKFYPYEMIRLKEIKLEIENLFENCKIR